MLLDVFGEERQNRLEKLKGVEEEWSIPELYYCCFLMRSKLICQCPVMIYVSRGKKIHETRFFFPME